MSEIPKSMNALVGNQSILTRLYNIVRTPASTNGAAIKQVPVPSIADDEILVKVSTVALNPTDYKHIDILTPRGCIVGCDYAGKVVKVGPTAGGNWTVGDRVAGVVHGGLFPDEGSFAEYLKVPGELAFKVPESVSDHDAATFGVSASTAMLCLNVRLDVPWVTKTQANPPKDSAILIYAGSTSAGLYAIQVAKLGGYQVVATASPHSFDLVKSYGVDAVFDYRSATAVDEIIAQYPDIEKAMDCFSEGGSSEFCARVMQKRGGRIMTLLKVPEPKVPGVKAELVLAYTCTGREFQWLPPIGPKFAAVPADRAALVRFYALLPDVLGKFKPLPQKALEGGLPGVIKGLDMLRQGKVSGSKLVATW